jgi:tetratricopeptide (TPR) repeat protein
MARMRQSLLLCMVSVLGVALLWSISWPGTAGADTLPDCFSGQLRQRMPSCTAIIEDPSTTALDRERALETRSIDLSIAGRFAEALQDLERALQINPNSAIALNGRAWAIYRWKKSTAGMNDVNKALQLDGTLAPAWDTRAHLFQTLGDFENAFQDYEAAVGFGGIPFIRTYQCGLKERGLYKGPIDGIYSAQTRTALGACAFSASCDPLPDNEFQQDCEDAIS